MLILAAFTALVIKIINENWKEFNGLVIFWFLVYQLVVIVQILDTYGKEIYIFRDKRRH